MTKRIIDVQIGDSVFIDGLYNDIENLCGCIEEAFEKNQTLLLSPVMRHLIRDHSRNTHKKLQKVMHILCVDNPSKPLSEQ